MLPAAFDQESLVTRKASLAAKQVLFQMQTLHSATSWLATLHAWAITRNCWRFLLGGHGLVTPYPWRPPCLGQAHNSKAMSSIHPMTR